MIKGRNKKEFLTTDEILAATNGGYDIFKYYLKNVSRIMNRPWGGTERHNSWGIFPKGIWYFKDQATEESGTAIQFVQKFFGLSFSDAMNKICWDFGLGGTKLINVNPVKITWTKPDIEKDYCDISIIDMPFKDKHHRFWNAAEVTEDHCRKMNCFAVKSLAINNRFIPIRKDEIVFAYYVPEFQSYKIYFPNREKGNRFRNNVPGDYLWNFDKLKNCEDAVVQKSYKDLIVTTMIMDCVTATQNESAGIFDDIMVNKINSIAPNIWVWYGSDDDGVKKCKKITGMNKWHYINTPKSLLPAINDTYGYATKFGLKGVEEFMKLKKLLK